MGNYNVIEYVIMWSNINSFRDEEIFFYVIMWKKVKKWYVLMILF